MFEHIAGNIEAKKILEFKISAAKQKHEPLMILIEGPSGVGKTSLCRAIAKELNGNLIELMPKQINRPVDLLHTLRKLQLQQLDTNGNKDSYPVLYIDESHTLRLEVQELLGVVMEGSFPSSALFSQASYQIAPRFSLIGSTTMFGKLSRPFRERFAITLKLKPYSIEESVAIVNIHAQKHGITIEHSVALAIAQRGKGTGRILVNHLKNIVDFALAEYGTTAITKDIALKAFEILGVDELGLNETDRKVLKCLAECDRGSLGLNTLATLTNESVETIAYAVEPYLMEKNLLVRGSGGRSITSAGLEYIYKTDNQYLTN